MPGAPGVVVDKMTFPFDSPMMLSPIFENGAASHSFSQSDELQRLSSLRNFFFNGDGFIPASSTADQSPAFHALDMFSSPSCSPSENGPPWSRNVDSKDDYYGQRVFRRALSKLGSNRSVAMMAEDLASGDDVWGTAEVPFSESVVEARTSFGLSVSSNLKDLANRGISIPLAPAYEQSCSSGGGGGSVAPPVFPDAAITALQKFLPSNNEDMDSWPAVDVYSCDEFRIYEFKVRRCMRGRSHDWTECPFAHPGEKARRRDPRRFHYSGTACPDFRKGSCRRGDACEFAHGVFECWLHPARYRTQPCKDGTNCRRRVCFFAHTPEQLRLLPGALQAACSKAASLGGSYDGSPLRQALAGSMDSALALESLTGLGQNGIFDGSCDGLVGYSSPRCSHLGFVNKASLCCGSPQISSPTSTLVGHSFSPPALSPPLSPSGSPPMSPNSPSSWSSALVRSLSCLSATQASHQCLTALSQAAALSQVQASIAHCSQNFGPISASTIGTHGPLSSSSAVAPAHRRHLDRFHSVPSVSITSCLEGRDAYPLHSPGSVSSDKVASSQAMNDLIVTLQQLELDANRSSDFWSSNGPSVHFSQSVPVTPTKAGWGGQIDQWDFADVEPLQRVESGRVLRANIYGRLHKEDPPENDSPDLGWVNELVK